MKNVFKFLVVVCLTFAYSAVFAQTTLTTGSNAGDVVDTNGAIVPGANVKLTGPLGERTTTTTDQGRYAFENLVPGTYTVRVEKGNFKAAEVTDVTVLVNKTTTANVTLQPGQISEVVTVTGGTSAVDQSTTAVSSNMNDQLFTNIPVQRAVSGLFYLAPGASEGLGGGRDNPSISGGSALDNLYVADGVNITDSAFGGIGTFSRSYGALGTGINTSFVKEVQVKTAGFEPQYGQSQGGIVNIVTQSGGNEYHGAIYGFASPKSFEATRKQADDFPRRNPGGKILHQEGYDAGADLSGYVPGARNNLFFFGSFNPTVRRDLVRGSEANTLNPVDSGLRIIRGPEFALRTRTYNYAAKGEWLITPNHQVTFSIFGDPSKTNKSSFRGLTIDNTTADSVLDYGTRNMALRYNGTWSPTLTFNASLGLGRSRFNETGFDNLNQITDRRGSDQTTIEGFTGHLPTRGNFNAVGLGFFEPTTSRTRRADFNLSKIHDMWGQHTLGIGYTFQRGLYDGTRDRSGPKWTIPTGNGIASGQTANVQWRLRFRDPATDPGGLLPLFPVQLDNGTTELIPVRLQVIRGEFGDPSFSTFSNYHATYVQDTWRFNKYITGLFGLRWEQEQLNGSPGSSGQRVHYTLTDNWAPRLGVTVDPLGHGKSKAFYNYGRFFEYLPLDLAERSLSAEKDWTGSLFIPEFTTNGSGQRVAVINQFGTVNPIVDAAHQLPGGTTISAQDPANAFAPGTKLGFTDEHTFGFEQQLPHNFTFSARYIDRRSKRIIEDAAVLSPEAALSCDWPNCSDFFINQVYSIVNISSHLDAFTNLSPFIFNPTFTTVDVGGGDLVDFITNTPAGCASSPSGFAGVGVQPNFFFPNGSQSVCFAQAGIDANGNTLVTPDGKPDGFPDAVRKYRALEIELNRRFSNGWQGFFNWRIAKLEGNFEGHLRNDNGQTDPGISSLFDFTQGDLNLLGDQFAIGPLNSDRRHIINVYGSYAFDKARGWRMLNGLNLGLNMRYETGLPINKLDPHPVYLNTGEIPLGGRGSQGRTPNYARFDVHTDYSWGITEKTRLKFTADFFNVFNSQKVWRVDENNALDFVAGVNPPNPDFLKPRPVIGTTASGYRPPFNLRLGVRFEF
ncbi:MAG TPA: carboxypeptidase regulatory-like domain-containing protein [Pyrinomonadaceae bacterium]|nr:carboxypeptidase regulatory-like domain-containing protein [Pyrinomonadaceae bacterium]